MTIASLHDFQAMWNLTLPEMYPGQRIIPTGGLSEVIVSVDWLSTGSFSGNTLECVGTSSDQTYLDGNGWVPIPPSEVLGNATIVSDVALFDTTSDGAGQALIIYRVLPKWLRFAPILATAEADGYLRISASWR